MQAYLSTATAADVKDQKFVPSVGVATTQIFNLQKQLEAINGDAKFTLLDLSQQKICDEKSKPKLTKTMSEETARARFAILPNQKALCTIFDDGSFDSGFKLWDLKDTKSDKRFLQQTKNIVELIIDFAVLDDNKLATYTYQINAKSRQETGCSRIKIWNTNTWESTTLKEEKAVIFSTMGSGLRALPNGQLLSFMEEKTLKVWDVEKQKCLHVYNDFSKEVAVFSNNDFAYSSSDNTIHLCTAGHAYKTLNVKRAVTALVALSNTQLAIGVAGNILIWDLQTNKLSTLCQLDSNRNVDKLAVLPDGRLASCQEGSAKHPMAFIQLWNIQTGECINTLVSANKKDRGVEQLTVLQDGRLINSWYCDGNKSHGITEWTFDYRALKLGDIRPLLQALQTNRSVTQVNLQQVAIDDKAIPELTKLVQKNLTLIELDVQNTLVSKAGIKELYDATRKRLPALKIKHAAMDAILQEGGVLQKPIAPVSVGITADFIFPYSELQLGEKLGMGGFGVVYKATWNFQTVAVKELLDEKPAETTVAEFKKEMQVMAKLRSEHIVQFYGCVLGNPKYCIVMQYMPKGSLFSVLHSNQTLDWSTRYKITVDMACGLAFLHTKNILHRDLKSLNVLLDEHYCAKITDFGLAKVKTETRTKTKSANQVGSEGWIAPELLDPEANYTQKSDVFSLGITFWEVASRKIPYEKAAYRAGIILGMAQGKREEIPNDCPPKMAHLIKWCWDTDPSKRPTAAEAVKYLRDAENDFKPNDNKLNQNDNAAQVNNLASASFAASYQPNSVVPANKK